METMTMTTTMMDAGTRVLKEMLLPELTKISDRLNQVAATQERIAVRLDQMDRRFDLMDKRFDLVDKRFEQIDQRFEQIGTDQIGMFLAHSLRCEQHETPGAVAPGNLITS
ncbi:MAG: hypothetical protein HY699_10580 [Deltaproteobacteria bacterium]|nr:hypothetical protein [Deltaproteobacteria bacterium]